jgi:hypothetical protein
MQWPLSSKPWLAAQMKVILRTIVRRPEKTESVHPKLQSRVFFSFTRERARSRSKPSWFLRSSVTSMARSVLYREKHGIGLIRRRSCIKMAAKRGDVSTNEEWLHSVTS